jgi:broad specificity phosphatase PhoE
MVREAVELLLVRHGQTDWNLEGRYQGGVDVPLNAAGREQAEALATELSTRRIDVVYSSPLGRALDTAKAIAGRHGLEVRVDPRLQEIMLGEWEGMLVKRIAEQYPRLFQQWVEDPRLMRPPGGESIREVHDRAVAAVEEMTRRHPGSSLCLVSHKVTLMVVRTHYLGLDLPEELRRSFANGGWERLELVARPRGNPCCSATAAGEKEAG